MGFETVPFVRSSYFANVRYVNKISLAMISLTLRLAFVALLS